MQGLGAGGQQRALEAAITQGMEVVQGTAVLQELAAVWGATEATADMEGADVMQGAADTAGMLAGSFAAAAGAAASLMQAADQCREELPGRSSLLPGSSSLPPGSSSLLPGSSSLLPSSSSLLPGSSSFTSFGVCPCVSHGGMHLRACVYGWVI